MNPPAGAEFPDRVVVSTPGSDDRRRRAWTEPSRSATALGARRARRPRRRERTTRRDRAEPPEHLGLQPTSCAICGTAGNADELYPATLTPTRSRRRCSRLAGCPTASTTGWSAAGRAAWSAPTRCSAPTASRELYRASTFDYGDELDGLRATYGEALARLAELVPERAGLLDIGTGSGFVLELAHDSGWTGVRGVEPSEDAIAKARARHPAADRHGRDAARAVRARLVRRRDDVPGPRPHAGPASALLEECRRVLRPGGVVLAFNHNVTAWSARLLGERSPIIDVEHTYLYSPRTMRASVRPGRLRGGVGQAGAQHLLAVLPRPAAPAARPAEGARCSRGCARSRVGRRAGDGPAGQPLPDRAPPGMKALVTGAGGFVGANLVRHLLRARRRTGRDAPSGRATAGDWRTSRPTHAIEFVDLTRPDDVVALGGRGPARRDLQSRRPRGVLLADRPRRDARGQRQGDRDAAGGGAAGRTLASSRPARRRSTASRTGRPPSAIASRPTPTTRSPRSAATHLCRLAAAQHGQHAVTLRLYSVYGPWEEPGRLMPTLVERALDGTLPAAGGPGDGARLRLDRGRLRRVRACRHDRSGRTAARC